MGSGRVRRRASALQLANEAVGSAEKSRTSFQAHQNAIFDLAWSQDDQLLVRYVSSTDLAQPWLTLPSQCTGYRFW